MLQGAEVVIDFRLIREKRKELSITQSALADEVEVSQTLISFIENGDRSPSIRTALAIADVLGVSLDELIGLTRRSGRAKKNSA